MDVPYHLAIDFNDELQELIYLVAQCSEILPDKAVGKIVYNLMGYLGKEIGIEYSICDFIEDTCNEFFYKTWIPEDLIGMSPSLEEIKTVLYRTGMYVHHSMKMGYKLYIGGILPYSVEKVVDSTIVMFRRTNEVFTIVPAMQTPFSFNK